MKRGTKGFALLDVLVALAILAGAVVAIQLASAALAFHQVKRENETVALGLLQETMEAALVSPAAEPETPFDDPFGRFSRTVEVANWEAKPDLLEVTVTIKWTGTTDEESLRMHTLVANY
jgi:type II secretory pathway pseudopilin PulG